MKRTHMAALGLLMAMMCRGRVAIAAGGNLIPNGSFNTDLSRWTGNFDSCSMYGGLCWSRDDAAGSSTSGSVVMAASLFTEIAMRLRSRCVRVAGGEDYTFSVAAKSDRFYFPYDPEADATATLLWSNNSECQGVLSSNEIRILSSSWKSTEEVVTAPVDAVAASVLLVAEVSVRARFDNVRLIHVVPDASTTTTTLACERDCGDPVADTTVGSVTASDALYILRAAVGEHTCAPCICDVNDDGGISATDALLALEVAVGEPVSLACPP